MESSSEAEESEVPSRSGVRLGEDGAIATVGCLGNVISPGIGRLMQVESSSEAEETEVPSRSGVHLGEDADRP